MTSDPRTFRRQAAVEMRRLTGAGILVDAQGNHFGINQVGVRIWELLEDAGSVDALVDALLREFDISATRCRAEVDAFVAELLARGLVERAETARGA
jgi:predicted DNA-binding transcriptional regulator